MKIFPFSVILLATTAVPAMATVDAQATGSTIAIAQDDEEIPVEEGTSGEIVVTAEHIRG